MRISIALASAVFLVAATAAAQKPERPNIVFLISDDHDFEHLGFMGNRYAHTPAIDRLAAAGTVFTTAHLPMSRCHPTLASFLSGRWPHQSGIYYNYGPDRLDPSDSLPGRLATAGYATYVEGKYWEGDPRAMGFTHGAGKTAGRFVRKGQEALFEFIDEVGGEQPMFIWWAPKIPHTPHNPPKRHVERFERAQLPRPEYLRLPVDPQGEKPRRRGGNFAERELKSYAMEAWLDEGVEQLVAKLEASGQHANTLYVFVIDNGWCNGLVSKGSPFEKGVRTPIFFSLPGKVPAGQRIGDLVSTLDLYPTILEYAGVEVPGSAAGRSLRARIDGRPSAAREALFGAIYPAFATKGDARPERDVYALYARTARWKYIYYLQDVVAERNGKYFRIQSILTDYPVRSAFDEDLYDLERDPHELRDLATDPAHSERMDALRDRLLEWWRVTGGKPLPHPGDR